MKRRLRTVTIAALLLGLAVFAWGTSQGTLSVERLAQQEEMLRASIAARPLEACALGLLLYVLLSVIPGTGGKAVVCGWLYGFWQGLVLVNLGLTGAAVIAFFLSRHLFLEAIQSRFQVLAARLDEAWRRDGAFYLLTLRLALVPYSLLNYAAGATGVPLRTFWWTTQLGVLPAAAIHVFLGSRLPSLEVLAEEGLHGLIDPWLAVAALLPALFPALVRYALRRWKRAAPPRGRGPFRG